MTSDFRIRLTQTEMLRKGCEVAVGVQEGQAVFDTPRRNQRVDGFADRDAFGSKNAVVLRRLQSQVVSAKVEVASENATIAKSF